MSPIIKTLLLMNVAMFLLDQVVGMMYGLNLNALLGLYYVGHPMFMPYQFVTYMFMHAGFTHLFFNMFALWMFGRVIVEAFGARRFLLYYFVCGLGSALVQEAGQLTGLIPEYAMTIGASGAVYGILLAFGVLYPNERMFIIPIPFPIKAKWFITFYVLIELFEGLSLSDGVAHFAHLGGMLFGYIFIQVLRHMSNRPRMQQQNYFWRSTTTAPEMHIHCTEKRVDDYEYKAKQKMQNDEIDRILDKVRKGGYQSLTESEKRALFDASKR